MAASAGCWPCVRRLNDYVILFLGVEGAGKTSLINLLTGNEDDETFPTCGFGSTDHHLRYIPSGRKRAKRVRVRFFDVGGGASIRGIWENYYAEAHGIVYVIDSTSSMMTNFQDTSIQLNKLVADPRINGKPILVLANKYDFPTALSIPSLCKVLRVPQLSELYSLYQERSREASASTGFVNSENIRIQIASVYQASASKKAALSTARLSKTADSHVSPATPEQFADSSPARRNDLSLEALEQGFAWLIQTIVTQCKSGDLTMRIQGDVAAQARRYEEERERVRQRVLAYQKERELDEKSPSWNSENSSSWGGVSKSYTKKKPLSLNVLASRELDSLDSFDKDKSNPISPKSPLTADYNAGFLSTYSVKTGQYAIPLESPLAQTKSRSMEEIYRMLGTKQGEPEMINVNTSAHK
ncbi:MAG: hypothetical protein SGCHY_001160, partial [Lobulomycetales sp.]